MASASSKLPRGLLCPLVTPLKTGDILDVAALDRLVRFVGAGADGLVLGDLFCGEGLELSGDTRAQMVEATLEFSEGRWPVFVTITSDTEEETVALFEQIKLSVEGSSYSDQLVWVDYPIYYHGNRGLPQFYEVLSRDTAVPFTLANDRRLVEGRKSNIKHKNIRTSVLKKLAGMDCIQGLIFTGSLKRAMNYQKAVRHSSGFKFYDGNEAAFIRQPSSDGVLAAGSNLLPQAWQNITRSCLNQFDVERQYADHLSHMWETGVMVKAFYDLYGGQPVLQSQNHSLFFSHLFFPVGIDQESQCCSISTC